MIARASRFAWTIIPALTLSACGGGVIPNSTNTGVSTAGSRPATNNYRDGTASPTLPPITARGSESGPLIGRNGQALINQFGQPRLNRRDGGAQVLQFTSDRCVLDAYLYPPRDGAEAVVTHIDTRSPQDGSDVNQASCVSTFQRR